MSNQTGPINLGNPEEVSILQLAEAILRATQSKSSIDFEPLPEDDPRRRQPDITAAREKLGWEPTVSLENGLARTLPISNLRCRISPSSRTPQMRTARINSATSNFSV